MVGPCRQCDDLPPSYVQCCLRDAPPAAPAAPARRDMCMMSNEEEEEDESWVCRIGMPEPDTAAPPDVRAFMIEEQERRDQWTREEEARHQRLIGYLRLPGSEAGHELRAIAVRVAREEYIKRHPKNAECRSLANDLFGMLFTLMLLFIFSAIIYWITVQNQPLISSMRSCATIEPVTDKFLSLIHI